MNINHIVSKWRDSTTFLERSMDLTIICLLFIFAFAVLFTIALFGFSLTLSVFETLWFISALVLCTISLRLRLLHLKGDPNYHKTRGMEERMTLLYWTSSILILIFGLSLSLIFPYIPGE